MLGSLLADRIELASFPVSTQSHRVPVVDGHTASLSVRLDSDVGADAVARTLASHRGLSHLQLPIAPPAPIVVTDAEDRPQPRLDAAAGESMVATVGRIRRCPVLTVKMLVVGHNLVRGAAAAALLNAEALHAMNLLPA